MSEAVAARGIVLSHGLLAEGLVDAVRQITGVEGDALSGHSNRGLSPEAMVTLLRSLVGEGPVVVFTDLPSGSCSVTARRLQRERQEILVIGGVNLPLLLDFILHRELPLAELGPRLVEKGRMSISISTLESERYARTAFPGR